MWNILPVDEHLKQFCAARNYHRFNFSTYSLIERLAEDCVRDGEVFYDEAGMLYSKVTNEPIKVTKFAHLLLENNVVLARCYAQQQSSGVQPQVWYSRTKNIERVDVFADFESEYPYIMRVVFEEGLLKNWKYSEKWTLVAARLCEGQSVSDVLLYLTAKGLIEGR